MRQYNPNATVEEIKQALILSATDLGPTGEDNAYGYGLPDASRLLEFMPPPNEPELILVNSEAGNNGTAFPGERTELYLSLNNLGATIDSVVGRLISQDPTIVTVNVSTADFHFGNGAKTARNNIPFEITIASGRP